MQYVNRTYRRSGTLWEGRFRSCLTGEEGYVLGCYRYIELNPVRAKMVEHPGELIKRTPNVNWVIRDGQVVEGGRRIAGSAVPDFPNFNGLDIPEVKLTEAAMKKGQTQEIAGYLSSMGGLSPSIPQEAE